MRQRARPPVPGFLLTTFTARAAQWANSAAWLSPSNAVRAFHRSAGVSGNCLPHCACRASIALADAVSAKPGAWALKPECFAVISRHVSGA
jgi:hypothetical protein